MQIFRLLLTLSILLTPLASAAGTSDWIPIMVKDGKLLVPSSFAGIEGYSIIDTGAHQSAINSRFLRKNNLLPDAADEVTVNGFFKSKSVVYIRIFRQLCSALKLSSPTCTRSL